jgi:hypothetical protein
MVFPAQTINEAGGMIIRWTAALCAVFTLAGMARAATPVPPGGSNSLQTAPVYNFGANPFGQNVAPVQDVTPGTLALVPAAPTSDVSAYVRNVHGYVAAGVATGGGAGVSAGVLLPLVPSKLDLAVSGSAGQIGNLPHPPGAKSTAPYNNYQATLNYHGDNFDAGVSVGGGRYPWLYPYAP